MPPTQAPGTLTLSPVQPCPRSRGAGEQGKPGCTCTVVQKADAPVVMGSDGEGLIWMTHHLVDLGWAWKERGWREGCQGELRETRTKAEEKNPI